MKRNLEYKKDQRSRGEMHLRRIGMLKDAVLTATAANTDGSRETEESETTHLVVDEELGRHHHEAKHVDEANNGGKQPAVPALMLLIQQ